MTKEQIDDIRNILLINKLFKSLESYEVDMLVDYVRI